MRRMTSTKRCARSSTRRSCRTSRWRSPRSMHGTGCPSVRARFLEHTSRRNAGKLALQGRVLPRELCVPAPMPRLVGDAMAIPARIRKREAESRGFARQPGECGGLLEHLLDRRVARRGEVQRATTVVFAVTGCRADAQDRVHLQTSLQLALDDAELIGDRAERGDDLQLDIVVRRCLAHREECAGRRGREPLFSLLDIHADRSQPYRFAYLPEAMPARIVAWHAQRERALDQRAVFGFARAAGGRPGRGERIVQRCPGVAAWEDAGAGLLDAGAGSGSGSVITW